MDDTLKEIETNVSKTINKNSQIRMQNRAERRMLAKKMGKKGREQFGTISETARKLSYINLIQNLRELNEKKENENNETTED